MHGTLLNTIDALVLFDPDALEPICILFASSQVDQTKRIHETSSSEREMDRPSWMEVIEAAMKDAQEAQRYIVIPFSGYKSLPSHRCTRLLFGVLPRHGRPDLIRHMHTSTYDACFSVRRPSSSVAVGYHKQPHHCIPFATSRKPWSFRWWQHLCMSMFHMEDAFGQNSASEHGVRTRTSRSNSAERKIDREHLILGRFKPCYRNSCLR